MEKDTASDENDQNKINHNQTNYTTEKTLLLELPSEIEFTETIHHCFRNTCMFL